MYPFYERFYSRRTPTLPVLTQQDTTVFGIVHFSMNTFTDREWGFGDEKPEIFNPSDFDAEQIVSACKDGGLQGIVLVCKHHDGFCLWPTKTTEHNITKSPWKNGQGDLVREFSDACKKLGMKFGVYVSPWDRNSAFYGTKKYLDIFQEQIREVLTNYGPVFEMWFDGANGGTGWYGGANERRDIGSAAEYYDWNSTFGLVRALQPRAVIFNGPDRRWAGSELGYLPENSSARYTPKDCLPEADRPRDMKTAMRHLAQGNPCGMFFLPPECDFPLRPGWFFHESENDKLRAPEKLLDIYLHSVGEGGAMNIGIAPDKRGRLHDNDVAALKRFGGLVRALRAVPVVSWPLVEGEQLLELNPAPFNVIELTEDITNGERVRSYRIEARAENGALDVIAEGTVIGFRRIRILDIPCKTSMLSITLDGGAANLQTYLAPLDLFRFDESSAPDPACVSLFGRHTVEDAALLQWDYGKNELVKGCVFRFFGACPGTPECVNLAVSEDGEHWTSVLENYVFDNIRANPVPRTVLFDTPVKARHYRVEILRTLEPGKRAELADLGILLK